MFAIFGNVKQHRAVRNWYALEHIEATNVCCQDLKLGKTVLVQKEIARNIVTLGHNATAVLDVNPAQIGAFQLFPIRNKELAVFHLW